MIRENKRTHYGVIGMKFSAEKILAEAKRLEPVLREIRRDFHRYPELGFHEFRTTKKIREILSSIPEMRLLPLAMKTGAAAELPGLVPSQGTIGLRCDIDALPIQEKNTHDFVSRECGKMHACGHDGHITVVLGAAMLLSRFRPDCTVRFLFQPAEETTPDGAPEFIAAGAADGLKNVWGFHLNATSDFGKIGYYDGAVMAGGTGFSIKVHGRSGHQSYPESCVNAIDVLTKIAVGLEAVKSTIRATRPYSITCCSLVAGNEWDPQLPGEGYLNGRLAFLEKEIDMHLRSRISALAEGICQLYGATCDIEYIDHLPITRNEPSMGEIVRKNAAEFGFETEEIFPSMGSDDFGCYRSKAPTYYMTFGIRKGADFPIAHTPMFNFDEAILPIAAAQFASCALA